ncbi:MAG TPA: hypothetical protein VE954_43430, partial [Oligoflexus sp.]|uniref:hypothetical protein n=1 Tax=Oligoflexus sp. TaxID=1971216 RepID=UPI002D3544B5
VIPLPSQRELVERWTALAHDLDMMSTQFRFQNWTCAALEANSLTTLLLTAEADAYFVAHA